MIWFTDPPYYDAIPYSDLSDFFFVWLIHPAESFVELPDEVILFLPRGATAEDVRRLRNAFAQPLMFIAATLPEGSRGYSTTAQACHDASPLLSQFFRQLSDEYADLADMAGSGTGREKGRQEWRFSEAGKYAKYSDGRTTRLALTPETAEPSTYTLIENSPSDLYFTESKSGPKGEIVEQGGFRRHRHDVGRQTYDNLDLFPTGDYPTLWRLVRAGRGFKAFPRPPAEDSPDCECSEPLIGYVLVSNGWA